MEAEVTTLKNRNTELVGEQCDALMDAHGLKTDAPQRVTLKPVLIGMKNRADRVTFLTECVSKPTAPAAGKLQTQLHNRDTKPPGTAGAGAGVETDEKAQQALSVKIRNRANELRAGKHLSFDAAWNQAKQELTPAAE